MVGRLQGEEKMTLQFDFVLQALCSSQVLLRILPKIIGAQREDISFISCIICPDYPRLGLMPNF